MKETPLSIVDMNIDKTKLYKNFIDINNIANIRILRCVKKLFTKRGLIKNIGNYVLITIILFHFLSYIIFFVNQLDEVKKSIFQIRYAIFNYNINENGKKSNQVNAGEKINNEEIKNNGDKIISHISQKKNAKRKQQRKYNDNFGTKNGPTKTNSNFYNNFFNYRNNIFSDNNNKYNGSSNNKIISIQQTKNYNNNINSKINSKNDIEKVKNIMKYTDDEINDLSYTLALQYDKRTYLDFYFSLLKTNHSFFNTFLFNNDYNAKIIKIDLFFINFASSYIINAFFFNDDTMHVIYKNQGSFGIEYQIPLAIYSYLISTIINYIIGLFALSNDAIIDFKQNKNIISLNKRSKKLLSIIKIRTILFFITSSIFLCFFWYYISMFCAIYRNTQYHLIKDTLMSFGISMITPFQFYLLPGFFRIPALSNPKNKRECLYKFSKALLIIFNIII